ncbi:hypothetical protein ACFYWS_20660 [Streptomyces sp. NPDC002795]|uniref:hypothetical protein n=1 Tax=Streptomyces sp. NPDC002795 TaxID=3364665 RepID=UPI00368BA64E
MKLAPRPDHGRTSRPEWQSLWAEFESVTTPLRAAGLVCDIETCGGNTVITVDLPDGSHLLLHDEDGLPDRLNDVTGWMASRGHGDNPTFDEAFYDSTESGEQARFGGDVAPLLEAIAAYLTVRPDDGTRDAGRTLSAVLKATERVRRVTSFTVTPQHTPLRRGLGDSIDGHTEAVKEYGWQTYLLGEAGWECVHQQGGDQWPISVWKRREALQVVFLQRARTV